MSSALKVGLAILLMVIVAIVLLPLFFWMAGVSVFPSSGGGNNAGSGIVLRSEDGGVHWEPISFVREKKNRVPSQALHIAFHPRNPDVLYMGTKGTGLWKSENAGKTWQKMIDSSGLLDTAADVYRIGMSTSSPDVLYIAVFQNKKGRVFRSDNGGVSFLETYFVAPDNIPVFDVEINPTDGGHLVIATGQGGVLVSRDSGDTWRVLRWFDEVIARVSANPIFFPEMYTVSATRRLRKTYDSGENWVEVGPSQRNIADDSGQKQGSLRFGEEVVPIQGFPQVPSLFAPFSSSNSGLSAELETFATDPENFERVFIGAVEGLYRSIDGGFSWRRVETLVFPSAISVTAVAVHPRNSGTLFAGIGSELYRSDDDGTTWSVRALPTNSRIRGLAIHPTRPNIMFTVLGK